MTDENQDDEKVYTYDENHDIGDPLHDGEKQLKNLKTAFFSSYGLLDNAYAPKEKETVNLFKLLEESYSLRGCNRFTYYFLYFIFV